MLTAKALLAWAWPGDGEDGLDREKRLAIWSLRRVDYSKWLVDWDRTLRAERSTHFS